MIAVQDATLRACDGTISCSTCHLIFKKEDFGKIDSPITDDEIDMLTLAKDYCDTVIFEIDMRKRRL
ncbi:Adrenodoxin, mitochondrial [Armadillidium nasatum]|uniref:Adrenodoxin, mitochondrial n=1 Tax=Armadillidium nasatum TaxID=96803 RepID=A0A5N5SMX8_9CRUS|nr:Adrenodoxin, mitochondrial [Armadillidium nasatum]